MNSKTESLIDEWHSYSEKNSEYFLKHLTFDYLGLNTPKPQVVLPYKPDPIKEALEKALQEKRVVFQNNIAEALCFWNFVRRIDNAIGKKDFLKNFPDNRENILISLVIRIELLPDDVWRKLLWIENIDFMSFESFLRRLTPAQEMSIRNTYNDLYGPNPKVPAVCKARLVDKIANWFTGLTPEKILAGEHFGPNRYLSKGAWSYSLFDLDFGFGLFPKGINDDSKIQGKDARRFLSIKAHINDFIVNQEFGRYWALYKSARSNYVWRPNKYVTLSTHICPGFWLTLFLHLLFWIISPVLFALFLYKWMAAGSVINDWKHVIPLVITLVPTPIFTLVALIKLFFSLIWKLIRWIGPDITEWLGVFFTRVGKLITAANKTIEVWWEKNEPQRELIKKIAAFFTGFIKGILLFAIFSFLTILARHLILQVPANYLGKLGVTIQSLSFSAILITGSLLWLYLRIAFKKFKEVTMPTIAAIIITAVVLFPAMQIAQVFVIPYLISGVQIMATAVLNTFIGFAHFVSDQTWFFTWTILGIGGLMIPLVTGGMMFNDEGSFAKLDRFLRRLFIIWALLMVITGYFAINNTNVSAEVTTSIGMLSFLGLIFFGAAVLFTLEINTTTIDNRQKAEAIAKKAEFRWNTDDDDKVTIKTLNSKNILKNKWLFYLSDKTRDHVLNKFQELLSVKLSLSMDRAWYVTDKLISKLTASMLTELQRHVKKFNAFEDFEKVIILRKLSTGISVLEAIAWYESDKLLKQQRKEASAQRWKDYKVKAENAYKILLVLLSPFAFVFGLFVTLIAGIANVFYILTFKWIIYLFKKGWEHLKTAKNLWTLFNEMCPQVSRSKPLE